ncbi:hypothetical protein N3K66_004180 [Trichothecium roseum]|uniref:Uncharacterized protein n=1 Tax=Trichothecium roseum TaxID=47278 RepID=A0ACC0V0I4_9HYPO|nr:hypothetical protein N3K66_004180 [Trichothecium roseum]
MGPQFKKRKLQATSAGTTPSAKRAKSNPKSKSKSTTTKQAPSRRAVEAATLPWETVGEEDFGALQVIENVQVIKEGNSVQFLVKDDKAQPATAAAEGKSNAQDGEDSFEGFGDDDVINNGGEDDAGKDNNGGEMSVSEDTGDEQAPAAKKSKQQDKKEKKQQQSQQKKNKSTPEDKELLQGPAASQFNLLPTDGEEEADDRGLDMAAWAALKLSPQVLTAIAKLRFAKPTAIQASAIPEIGRGRDVIGKAQTGSGKTLAFGIPIVERWLEEEEEEEGQNGRDYGGNEDKDEDEDDDDEIEEENSKKKKKGPMAIVLSPTRELAKQLGDHLKALCEGLPSASPYVCVVTGGLSIHKQQRQLLKADIVIGTPGRLWEVMEGDAKLQDQFAKIRFLVVDEADRLLKAGQFKEAQDIIGALDKTDPEADDDDEDDSEEDGDDEENETSGSSQRGRQTLVFSATFDTDLQTKLANRVKPKKLKKKKKKKDKGRKGGTGEDGEEEDDKMEYLMRCLKFRRTPKFIDVNPVSQMASGLKEGLIECGAMEKDLFVYTALILHPTTRTLIFTNSISAVRRLTPLLTNLNLSAHPLHSQMPQKARLRSLERFAAPPPKKTGAAATSGHAGSILVATDVAARGLDIPDVDMVLHYHVPRQADTYVHRSGRTARGDRTGVSVMLCAPEEVLPTLRLAGKVHAGKGRRRSHVIHTIPVDRQIPSRLKPRVDLAKKLADAVLAKEKAHSAETFMQKAADDLGVEYDGEDDLGDLGYRGGRGGGRKKKEKEAGGISKAEMAALRARLRDEMAARVNLGVSERYIAGGRVDVTKLLREREQGGGLFLGGDGLQFGFDL